MESVMLSKYVKKQKSDKDFKCSKALEKVKHIQSICHTVNSEDRKIFYTEKMNKNERCNSTTLIGLEDLS